MTCERATRYDWERETDTDVWEAVATDAPLSILIATGLPAGNMTYRAKGKNSMGESEWSEPAEITIQGQAGGAEGAERSTLNAELSTLKGSAPRFTLC